jgi:hypothetical protein
MRCAAYNLGLLLRKVFGMAKPRCADAGWGAFSGILAVWALVIAIATDLWITEFLALAMLAALLIVVWRSARRKLQVPRVPELGVL